MKDSRVIYKGRLISLATRTVKLPNKFIARLEVITHPGAALVVPFLSRDKIILLRQLRPVIKAYLYELPAGTLKKNETALSCGRREIVEETGYSAKRFTRLGYIYPVPGYSTERIVIFKAEGLSKKNAQADDDEIIRSFIVTRKQLKAMLRKGKIVDAKTICALALCGWL
jgi:ADP-ribose pyrophosphatase